jgi:hypothetical protein
LHPLYCDGQQNGKPTELRFRTASQPQVVVDGGGAAGVAVAADAHGAIDDGGAEEGEAGDGGEGFGDGGAGGRLVPDVLVEGGEPGAADVVEEGEGLVAVVIPGDAGVDEGLAAAEADGFEGEVNEGLDGLGMGRRGMA